MTDEKKYFGMTMMQIGILGGLALALVCIVAVCGGLILSGGVFGRSQQTIPTVAPTVTSALAFPPTMTPTITPTPVPYEQLIPAGWNQYKTELIEIWLPTNFKKTTKAEFEQLKDVNTIELLAQENAGNTSLYNMVVAVYYDPMGDATLDEYLKEIIESTTHQVLVTENRTVYVNSVQARRIVTEIRVDNIDVNSLVYVFQDGNTAWWVTYTAEITEFYNNLPVFEQSVKTFRVAQ
jgi:hypothetical protein